MIRKFFYLTDEIEQTGLKNQRLLFNLIKGNEENQNEASDA